MADPQVLTPLDQLQKDRRAAKDKVGQAAIDANIKLGQFAAELSEVANKSQIALLALAQRPQMGPILLNCTLSEVHSIEAEITERPVDASGSVSDHYIRMPRIFSMEASISEYPDNIAHQFGHFGPGRKYTFKDRKATAWADIKALWESETPFEMITDLEVYPRMLIQSVETVQQDNSDILFRALLKEYRIIGLSIEDQLAISQLDYSSPEANVGSNQGTGVLDLGLDAAA